jgi:hypothetical protein
MGPGKTYDPVCLVRDESSSTSGSQRGIHVDQLLHVRSDLAQDHNAPERSLRESLALGPVDTLGGPGGGPVPLLRWWRACGLGLGLGTRVADVATSRARDAAAVDGGR